METEKLDFNDGEVALEAFVARPDVARAPLVFLCHAWRGRDEFICEKAMEIARLGYVGFALDIYGKGVCGRSKEENRALKQPFLEDRLLLRRRLEKAWEAAISLDFVDSDKVAAVGFGFGGLCALDMARNRPALKGAVSVYGHFEPPGYPTTIPIKAKILILHGYEDPVVSIEDWRRFHDEMKQDRVDWQAHFFSGTMHAFATPGAQDPGSGIRYNPLSAMRAEILVQQFLAEVFS